MAAKTVTNFKSALSENSKMVSLSQEVVRRMRNTSEWIGSSERIEVINKFCQKLATSGYGREQIGRIITAGLKGYEKALQRHKLGNCTEVQLKDLQQEIGKNC